MESKNTSRPDIKGAVIDMPEKAWGKIERAREFARSLYEKRGYVLGNELQVWLDAGKKIKKYK
jgi:hypothetical protein